MKPFSKNLPAEPKILYEDNDLAVIAKPAGLASHPSASAPAEKTLVDFLASRWPEIKNVGEDPSRPGIVHRLDKETSGIMVIAKSQKAFLWLKREFQERRTEKTYLGLVVGKLPTKEGKIDFPIGRAKKFGRFTTRSQAQRKEGKIRPAITGWKVLKEYHDGQNPLTLLQIKPETGRTHQVRVHLAAIGHPLVGDWLYGGKLGKEYRRRIGRFFLHAQALKFTSPAGKVLLIESDLPRELALFLEMLEAGKS